MKTKKYSILIKKSNGHFIALSPELNVSAQGESLVEAREEIAKAIKEYLAFSKKTGITSASLDVETLKEFLLKDIDQSLRLDNNIAFSENFSTSIAAL